MQFVKRFIKYLVTKRLQEFLTYDKTCVCNSETVVDFSNTKYLSYVSFKTGNK